MCLPVLPVSGIGGDSEVILSKKQYVVMLAGAKECGHLWGPGVGQMPEPGFCVAQ